MSRLLLISNSTQHGRGFLDHCAAEVHEFYHAGRCRRILFVPYAQQDHDSYATRACRVFEAMGFEFSSLHTADVPRAAVEGMDGLFVGGGNSFRLLANLYELRLLDAIRESVLNGMPYTGSSAGSNVACPSIRTTNDMPIVFPPSFDALGLVPFQINPHYLDPDPNSKHMGETRETRIREFHEENTEPVIGLREGCLLRIEEDEVRLKGSSNARLFRRGERPVEYAPGSDLSFLLG